MKKIAFLILFAILIASFFLFDLGQYFTLEEVKKLQGKIADQNPILVMGANTGKRKSWWGVLDLNQRPTTCEAD